MTMTIEKKLRDFTFWGKAATNAAKLTPEELDKLEEMLTEIIGDDDPWSTTEVNEWMWFDFEDVCEEWLDISYEEVMARE